jgi:hypothetical protein
VCVPVCNQAFPGAVSGYIAVFACGVSVYDRCIIMHGLLDHAGGNVRVRAQQARLTIAVHMQSPTAQPSSQISSARHRAQSQHGSKCRGNDLIRRTRSTLENTLNVLLPFLLRIQSSIYRAQV